MYPLSETVTTFWAQCEAHSHTYIHTHTVYGIHKKPKHKSIRFETHELITFRRGEFSHKNKRSIDDANAKATPTEIQNKEMKEKTNSSFSLQCLVKLLLR